MYPIQRALISLALALVVYFIIPKHFSIKLTAMILWISFALFFLISCWVIFFTREVDGIKKIASREDGSKVFLILMVLASSFASMFTVLLLMLSTESERMPEVFLPVAIGGMLLAWTMVHTIFTFHYAHIYYDTSQTGMEEFKRGLDFPGGEDPDYIDFAYFSFVIGSTFQVSDVEIISRKIRRIVLLHGLISFALNTFVVALTINLIAGLKK